ncbi:MAG: glycosyl hydrolase-related protein, partial [Anaerolineales bacterium]
GKIGLMIANRGLPEVEVITLDGAAQSEIAVTLLRSVGWLSRDDMSVRQGHAGPAFETPGGQVPGKWEFEIAIIPHTGDWLEAYQLAYAFQSPPRVVETGLHAGELPPQGSFIGHSPADFVVSAVKKGEDELGWIVRGYNITSKTIRVKLRPLRRFAQAWQVNLAEQKIQALEIEEDGSVELPVDGHKISTILFSD